jgi:hypothetical protein
MAPPVTTKSRQAWTAYEAGSQTVALLGRLTRDLRPHRGGERFGIDLLPRAIVFAGDIAAAEPKHSMPGSRPGVETRGYRGWVRADFQNR